MVEERVRSQWRVRKGKTVFPENTPGELFTLTGITRHLHFQNVVSEGNRRFLPRFSVQNHNNSRSKTPLAPLVFFPVS